MATIRRKIDENDEKEFAYVVLHNGMDDVFTEINKFCKGEYGRECTLYEAFIAKRDPNNYATKEQEFDGVGADLLETVRSHLKQARDFITFNFSLDDQAFTINIIPGTEQEYLAERMQNDDLDELEASDTVVMVAMDQDAPISLAEQFLDNL